MTQAIVLVIIDAMISNDLKIGIMNESKKSLYKYCLIVKMENEVKLNASFIITSVFNESFMLLSSS